MKTLRMIDAFSGIGGFSLAARWVGGFETIQFVERDPYCQQVLAKHWPTVPIHDDICTFNPEPHSADIVCGGFPCQDISQAGKGAGLAGSRSGLFYELLRVVRLVGPRYIVLENVAAITYRGMDDVLGALAEAGFDAEWACIPAAAVGACHQRDRWWCVAYAQGKRWGARPGQGASQTGYQRPRTGDGGAGSDVAYSQNMLSHGGAGQQQGQPQGQSVPESGNGDRADAANTIGQRFPQPIPPAFAPQEGQPAWPPAPRRLNPDWRSHVSQPVLCGGDAGLSNGLDRLKALGNAVVPQVAMVPLARVLELDLLPAK